MGRAISPVAATFRTGCGRKTLSGRLVRHARVAISLLKAWYGEAATPETRTATHGSPRSTKTSPR